MQTSQIDLIPFCPEHLLGAHALSRQAQWPHRLEDWRLVFELSHGMAAVTDGNRLVGTILVTPYKDDCATINMVIVDEAMRGRGLGRKLMDAALSIAGKRPLRLVATAEGLPLYQKLGFEETATVAQHQGTVAAVAMPVGVQPATAADVSAICELDREAFGADRSELIAALTKVGELAVLRADGVVSGYAALRTFGRGEVIGPVVAADAQKARALTSFFMAPRRGEFLRVDTTTETGLGSWLVDQGLAHVGGGIAMRRPNIRPTENSSTKTFALANQALG